MFKDEPSSKFVNEYEGIEKARPAAPQTFYEAAEKAVEAFTKSVQALVTTGRQIVEKLVPIVTAYVDLVAQGLKKFPNKRVVHLALHAKKTRTRKKNMNRIIKWMEDNT